MRRVAAALGLDPALVRANRQADVALAEPRPADVSLDTSRLAALLPDLRRPTIEEAVRLMTVCCRHRRPRPWGQTAGRSRNRTGPALV